MTNIYRGQFSTLWLTLQSNEQLGLLDSDYLEDYFGNDGQVTLHHIGSATDYPVLMLEQQADTPAIPHDVFRGQIAMAGLPNGAYELRGRCRDIAGNYTVLSSIQNPAGNEQVLPAGLTIAAGQGFKYQGETGAGLARTGFSATPLAGRVLPPAMLSRPALNPIIYDPMR